MFKHLALVAFAVTVALPAMAQPAAPTGERPAMTLEQMKAKDNEHHTAMKAKMAERQKTMEACHSRAQAATTTEAFHAVKKECHEKAKAERAEMKAKWKEKHGEKKAN